MAPAAYHFYFAAFLRYVEMISWLPLCGRYITRIIGRFHRGGIIQGVLFATLTPWKTPRKSIGEWDYRTRIIPILSSMKPDLWRGLTLQRQSDTFNEYITYQMILILRNITQSLNKDETLFGFRLALCRPYLLIYFACSEFISNPASPNTHSMSEPELGS
jgi:hypothetical protein